MGDDEFVLNRVPGRVYFSKEFAKRGTPDKRGRFATRVFKTIDRTRFATIKNELVLRTTASGRHQLKALFTVDDRQIDTLHLQKFTVDSGRAHESGDFCLFGSEIDELIEFAYLIRQTQFSGDEKVRITPEQLQNYAVSKEAVRALMAAEPAMVAEVAEQNISKDIVAVAYRRKQLAIFRRMVEDAAFFNSERERLKARGPEAVWQAFFESNPWIFGYGLFFVFTTGFDETRLEQTVAGYNVGATGKRTDALLKTRGLINSLCFVEIKTHETELLDNKQVRPGSWPVSSKMIDAIAQSHATIQAAERQLGVRVAGVDTEGNPTGQSAFLLRPRSVLVIGSLKEFMTNDGVNEPKFTSFELFRRQLVSPEVITFDELLERAEFIVNRD